MKLLIHPLVALPIGILVVAGLYSWSTKPPTTEQQKQRAESAWVAMQQQRCKAMGGYDFYGVNTKQFECFRHPAFRMTKTLFTDQYNP